MEKNGKKLEDILESIDETRHLSELMEHRSRDMKGATANEILNKIIHPTLDDLELYLRYYAKPGLSNEELKELVHNWIEAQMSI